MKKQIFGRRLKRDKNERKALFKTLMSSLFLHGRIKTTTAKAKAIKGSVEKIITKIKKSPDQARHFISRDLVPGAVDIAINEVTPRFQKINGGYTRIIRLGPRMHDNAEMAVIEFTDLGKTKELAIVKPAEKKTKLVAKKEKAK